MIDEEITFREKGYRSTDLSHGSNKEVWAVCEGDNCEREGGRGRWVKFYAYVLLCPLCARRTDDYRKKMSNSTKGKNSGEKNGMYGMSGEKSPMYGRICDDKTKELMRKAKEGKYCGEDNPMWKGGISFEPYCDKFTKTFKETVREKFGWLCFMCGGEEHDEKLCVHHVSYDKECMCNGKECEFFPVCRKCHSRTNHNRELWERLIINVLCYEGWID